MKLTWGKLALVATGGLVLSATIAAQQPAKPAQAPPDQPSMGEQFDKAHEGIYNKTDKAEDASRLTEDELVHVLLLLGGRTATAPLLHSEAAG